VFKNTSQNAQSRTDRSALHRRKNESGVDPAVYAEHPAADTIADREKLIRDKSQVEQHLAAINARLRQAKAAFNGNTRSQTGYDTVARWESQRATLVGKLTRMNALLSNMNYERRVTQVEAREAEDGFPRLFMTLAREVLADEVYNRIVVAAVHRQRGN
jgi:hypothetical protein